MVGRGGGKNTSNSNIAPGRLQSYTQSMRNNLRTRQDDKKMFGKDPSSIRRQEDVDIIVCKNLARQRAAAFMLNRDDHSPHIIEKQMHPVRNTSIQVEEDILPDNSGNGSPEMQNEEEGDFESAGFTPSTDECQLGKRKRMSKLASRVSMALQATEALDPPLVEEKIIDQELEQRQNTNSHHSTTHSIANEGSNAEATSKMKGKGSRGKYKSYVVDMKIKGKGSKLTIFIPDEIDRAIGENVRHLVNECGRVVRTKAPLNVKNWKEAFSIAGDSMWKEI